MRKQSGQTEDERDEAAITALEYFGNELTSQDVWNDLTQSSDAMLK